MGMGKCLIIPNQGETSVQQKWPPGPLCATEGECQDPVILHDSASRDIRKVGNWRKTWWNFIGKR